MVEKVSGVYHFPEEVEVGWSGWRVVGFTRDPKPSKIRVTLSRPLTWAEWEHLVNVVAAIETDGSKHPVKFTREAFDVIHIESSAKSRSIFKALADFLGSEFVNVFPKAVLTKQEAG